MITPDPGPITPRMQEALITMIAAAEQPMCAYVYDLTALRAHANAVVSSLPAPCRLLYAMKANSEPPILRTLAGIVHGFEVASLGEIHQARAIHSDLPLAFGGPGKTDAELEGALQHGVEVIHVESALELLRLEQVAARLATTQPVLLRVNLAGPLPGATLSMAGRPSQFGIDTSELPRVLALVADCPHLEFRGFHFHSISNDLDADAHAALIERYLQHARRWSTAAGLTLACVNVGGGIGINYADITQQFDWPRFVTRLESVLERSLPPGCRVVFECGRYLVAGCGVYAAEVIDLKTVHGHHQAIIRGGTHHFRLPASWRHSHPFQRLAVERWPYRFPRPEVRNAPITIAGQLCSPKDVLARDVEVDSVRMGDLLVFAYAGAYGWAISHHDFLSHPHPDQIFLDDEPSQQPASDQLWRNGSRPALPLSSDPPPHGLPAAATPEPPGRSQEGRARAGVRPARRGG